MTWLGTWRNQYGSTITITDERAGKLEGTFRTTIQSSPFYERDVAVYGAHAGLTASVSSATDESDGVVVCYTGKLQDGRWETLWLMVAGEKQWWSSVVTNHDTFELIEP